MFQHFGRQCLNMTVTIKCQGFVGEVHTNVFSLTAAFPRLRWNQMFSCRILSIKTEQLHQGTFTPYTKGLLLLPTRQKVTKISSKHLKTNLLHSRLNLACKSLIHETNAVERGSKVALNKASNFANYNKDQGKLIPLKDLGIMEWAETAECPKRIRVLCPLHAHKLFWAII